MNKALGIAFLAIGVILLIWGFNVTESLSSEFSQFFTGSPSNRAIWLLIGGAACSVFGLVSLLSPTKAT